MRNNDNALGATQGKGGIGLQNRCTTTVLSRQIGGFSRVSAIYRQRGIREMRGEQRFATAQRVAQSVPPLFAASAGVWG